MTLLSHVLFAGTITKNEDNQQVLDKLQVERERGITVKAQTATMFYVYNGVEYLINLIDTPVSRLFFLLVFIALNSSLTLGNQSLCTCYCGFAICRSSSYECEILY